MGDNMKTKGFTLVELAVTIVIILALMSVSVPIYNASTTRVKLTEGYALLATIRSAQERYYTEYGNFLLPCHASGGNPATFNGTFWTNNEEVLGINARTNKYFTWFCISSIWPNDFYRYRFRASATGSGGILTMDYNLTSGVTIL